MSCTAGSTSALNGRSPKLALTSSPWVLIPIDGYRRSSDTSLQPRVRKRVRLRQPSGSPASHAPPCKPCTPLQAMHPAASHAPRCKPCTPLQAMHPAMELPTGRDPDPDASSEAQRKEKEKGDSPEGDPEVHPVLVKGDCSCDLVQHATHDVSCGSWKHLVSTLHGPPAMQKVPRLLASCECRAILAPAPLPLECVAVVAVIPKASGLPADESV